MALIRAVRGRGRAQSCQINSSATSPTSIVIYCQSDVERKAEML